MSWRERSKEIFQLEIEGLKKVQDNIGDEVNQAVEMIYQCKGKLVILGIGKTGIIGHKIAASLASTGTQTIFINAAEAIHGDLGMIGRNDVVMLISHSGTSSEILNVISPIRNIGCAIIAMTGNPKSALAQKSDVVLNVAIEREACPLGLAPTTSTTAALVMGDALMVCLMEKRHFQAENFALYHPGGALGRQLLTHVKDEMSTDIPRVYESTLFKDIIHTISDKRKGMTMVYDDKERAVGIITDGDVRRAVQRYDNLKCVCAKDFMTLGFKSIAENALLTEALELMDVNNITNLAVTQETHPEQVVGVISIHDIIDFR